MTRDFIDSVALPVLRANSLRWLLQAMSQTNLRNQLLSALPLDESTRLSPHLESVPLSLGQVLHEPNCAIDYAYFPTTAVISYLNRKTAKRRSDIISIGNEGMIGIPLILHSDRMNLQAVVQISGAALRISASALQSELHHSPGLQLLLLRYVQTLMNQMTQDLTCTKLHSTQERCCYLLLLTCDRIDHAILPITQTMLAQMVGVRRDRIGAILARLEKADLIQHQRGRISILNRPGLEATACDCYRILQSSFHPEFR